jgi:hypothetical protein
MSDARSLDRALIGLAVGRLVIGAVSRLSPSLASKLAGAGQAVSPELDYMTRVFGIRAIALGTGYLASSGDARRLWQRLAFVCDVSDTIAGAGALQRGGVPASAGIGLTALTGTYAAVGAARILTDLQGSR